MIVKVGWGGEPFAAHRALVRLLSAVDPPVRVKWTRRGKSFATHVTHVRFLSCKWFSIFSVKNRCTSGSFFSCNEHSVKRNQTWKSCLDHLEVEVTYIDDCKVIEKLTRFKRNKNNGLAKLWLSTLKWKEELMKNAIGFFFSGRGEGIYQLESSSLFIYSYFFHSDAAGVTSGGASPEARRHQPDYHE